MTTTEEPQATYDVVVAHLEKVPQGLQVSDAGLKAVATRLAAVDGDARLDRLMGVVAALEFCATQESTEGARASLLALIVGVLARTGLSEAQAEAWAARVKKTTGAETATKVLSAVGAARPEGTVPAGPAARFAALKKI